MRSKILLISFVLSLPFWWGINILAKNLEDFWFLREMAQNPQILTAEINQKILEMKIRETELERLQVEKLKNLEFDAESVISVKVDNQGNEKVLFEKNSKEPLPIASLTKLMTALVVFDLNETYGLDQLITVSREAVEQEGSSKYGDLRIGEKISVKALLHIMLIESSNDAAFALAQLIGEDAFVDLMSFYAKNLGLENTYFVNSNGLEPDDSREPKNLSTASDLAKLAKYILENYPQIFEITAKQFYTVLKPDGSIHHFIPQNTNELLGEFPEIIGGKTGETPRAGQCFLLVTKTPENKGYIINVILGTQDRVSEMKKLISSINAPQ